MDDLTPLWPSASEPWPAPDPTHRSMAGPAPTPPEPPRRPVTRRIVVGVLAVIVAVALAFTGYAVARRNTSSGVAELEQPPTSAVAPSNGGSSATAPSRTSPPATAAPSTPSAPSNGNGSASTGTANTNLEVGVVDVNTRLGYQNAAAAGTGIILTASGEVLTNNHVIDGATSISVRVVSTGKTYTATVLGSDQVDDVALLQLKDASGLQPANLGDSAAVKVGDPVTAVGNAGGDGGEPSTVTGVVTDLDQTITATDAGGGNSEQLTGLIQMNARLQPGDSGGPLYNAAGQVIGMNTAASANRRFRTTGAEAYAIPLAKALDIVHQIESGQGSANVTIGIPGFLGVGVDYTNGSGALITDVVAGTPAEHTGLVAGDTITAIDGQAIDSPDSLTSVLRNHHPGDSVKVTWSDQEGQSHTADVTLASGPVS
jgi:S1-C subfamily serine protease